MSIDMPGDPMLDLIAGAQANLILLERIQALEGAQIKLATDLVKALSDLSGSFREEASLEDAAMRRAFTEGASGEYDAGKAAAHRADAARVDELSTGPVMQAALDIIDAQASE